MNRQQRNLVVSPHTCARGTRRYTLSAEYLPKYLNWNSVETTNNPEKLISYLNERTGLDWTNIQFDWDGVSIRN